MQNLYPKQSSVAAEIVSVSVR